jgi:hypothetical protein
MAEERTSRLDGNAALIKQVGDPMTRGLIASVFGFLGSVGLALGQAAPSTPGPTTTAPTPVPSAQTPAAPPATHAAAGSTPTGACAAPPADGHVWTEAPAYGSLGRVYVGAEYLLWRTRGMRLPPLVTTGSTADTSLTFFPDNFNGTTVGPAFLLTLPGSLGPSSPNTSVLFGGSRFEEDLRSGSRLTVGLWLDSDQTAGIEASGFFLEPTSKTFTATSDGSAVLARPFFDTIFGAEAALPIAGPAQTVLSQPVTVNPGATLPVRLIFPVSSSGGIGISTTNDFWGAELDGRAALMKGSWYRVDALAGFRYLQLKEALSISSFSNTTFPLVTNTLLNTAADIVQGQLFYNVKLPSLATGLVGISDSFVTHNDFYGGQIGVQAEADRGIWFVDLRAKMAFGVTHQVVDVSGFTASNTTAGASITPGGLLAVASNSGQHNRYEFGLVPEVGINLGCQITRHLRGTVGYSVLYMRDNVVRPGDQIDRFVNSSQVPAFGVATQITGRVGKTTASPLPSGEARPAFFFRNDDFWAQGINAGLELSF